MKRLSPALLLALSLPGIALAGADITEKRDQGTFTMVDENDWWGKWSDKYYTNGTRFAWTTPDYFSDSGDATIRRATFAISHEIYAPKDGFTTTPAADDHPYAGVFYGSLGYSWETDDHLDSVQLDLGIAGPSALGDKIQQNWHHLIDNPVLKGWDTQMKDEPVAGIVVERRWRFDIAGERTGWSADILPRVVGIAGTLRTEAVVGTQLRFGKNIPRTFGHASIRQNTAYSGPRDNEDTAFYGFVDFQAEAVQHNMALQGGYVHDSKDVGRKPFVGQISVGLTYAIGGLSVSLVQTIRTEEFKGQDHAFVFGGLTGSVSF